VDVGSIEFIHEQIVAERDKGVAVLIVSTELDEVYALADRIAVFFHGRIMGIVGPDTPRDVLGQMMAGATAEELRAAGAWPDGARRTGAQPTVPPQTDAPPTDAPQADAPQATAQHPKEQA
jgi:simple sugar transport system ATP-binding protein